MLNFYSIIGLSFRIIGSLSIIYLTSLLNLIFIYIFIQARQSQICCIMIAVQQILMLNLHYLLNKAILVSLHIIDDYLQTQFDISYSNFFFYTKIDLKTNYFLFFGLLLCFYCCFLLLLFLTECLPILLVCYLVDEVGGLEELRSERVLGPVDAEVRREGLQPAHNNDVPKKLSIRCQ